MFFGWSNNQINIRQVNSRKINLITYVWGPKKIIRHIGSQAIEVNMSSWVKKKEAEFWNIKGKEDNLQGDGKNIW